MTEPIVSFQGHNWFLSNFSQSQVEMDGEIYPTIEHAFQAAKTHDPVLRQEIREAGDARTAKHYGRRVKLRSDWEEIKIDVMRDLLRKKFSDPVRAAQLLATKDAFLIEGNTWNDRFWGAVRVNYEWVGENWLGRLLMEIRAEHGGPLL